MGFWSTLLLSLPIVSRVMNYAHHKFLHELFPLDEVPHELKSGKLGQNQNPCSKTSLQNGQKTYSLSCLLIYILVIDTEQA